MIKKIYNPLFEGDFIADVEAHTFDGATYFYGSTDNVPDEWCSDTYNVYSTNDFTKVHHHGRSLHINQLNCPTLRLMYAPDAIQKDGCTYLYICCDDNSEWVVKSRLPYSDFQEPIKLDALGIDPSIFIDDDGSVYYFWGQFFLNGAKLNDDMHSID